MWEGDGLHGFISCSIVKGFDEDSNVVQVEGGWSL